MKKRNFLLLILVLNLFSCSEEFGDINSNELSTEQEFNIYEKNVTNEALEILSIAYANAIENEMFRSEVKREALKKFDGDYDILHKTLQDNEINGIKIKEILATNLTKPSIYKSTNIAGYEYLDSLISKIENLQISIPIHCDSWDISSFTPKVIFLPTNFSERTFTKVKAYDAQGNYEWVSSIDEPEIPYIVIGRSERVTNKQITSQKLATQDNSILKSVTMEVETPKLTSVTYGNPKTHFVKWDPTENETGYEIWISSGGAYTKVGTNGINNNEFVHEDVNMTIGTRYSYKVRATMTNGYSNWSNSLSINASERTNNKRLKVSKLYMSKSRLKTVESW
ncbi:hypothetical protein [Roseimarinus sediminis]|uniref:hypothetical protein n=1 Tax=Roseimarinus sediminis TaxID=1610899 RepID=UPI003D1E4A18